MERLAYWLCAGLASLGSGASVSPGAHALDDARDSGNPVPWLGGVLRETRIRYPLQLDDWQAVDEHLFEEQEHGVCVRYAHGGDRDRWIDVYFYPAGALSAPEFVEAARQEADLIRQAHALAGYADFDMGPLRDFLLRAPDAADAGVDGSAVEGVALDLAYRVDGTLYSSAMTLLLDRLYFVKARLSIRHQVLPRRDARRELVAFTAHLQSRLLIRNTGSTWASTARHGDALIRGDAMPRDAQAPGLREIRLEFHIDQFDHPRARPSATTTDAGFDDRHIAEQNQSEADPCAVL